MRPSTVRHASLGLSLALIFALNVAPARATDAQGLPSLPPAAADSAPAHAAAHAAAAAGSVSPDEARRLAAHANQSVIVLLRDRSRALIARGLTRAARVSAVAADQQPVLNE